MCNMTVHIFYVLFQIADRIVINHAMTKPASVREESLMMKENAAYLNLMVSFLIRNGYMKYIVTVSVYCKARDAVDLLVNVEK